MLNRFLPNEYVKSIFEIKLDELIEKGIKGIITDLDNTLVPWDAKNATPNVIEWFELIASYHLKVTIISNNNEERVKTFSDPLGIPYLFDAKKPLQRTFNKGAQQMNLANDEIAVIGDQLLTDILGGNSGGYYTILVVPIVQTDAKITKMNRFMERKILNYLRKKGKLNWEDE